MDRNIKVVIGANYGDEGKGLMTDYFCRALAGWNIHNSCGIVVLSNGGAQRGHTVETEKGDRIVFHHYGSGLLAGYDTYCPEQFIINPAQFIKETQELRDHDDFMCSCSEVYVHSKCKWTTPFDMILNQALLIKKGKKNSCGMGIWETIQRYKFFEDTGFNIPSLRDFVRMDTIQKDAVFAKFLHFFHGKLEEYGIDPKVPEMAELFSFDEAGIVRHFIRDCDHMCHYVNFVDSDKLALSYYPNVIFENAQGLAIDGGLANDKENNTPSYTGLHNPLEIIESVYEGQTVEVCYVSRSYFTRHGDGYLENECDPQEINLFLNDRTNVPNDFQGTIRYGTLDLDSVDMRVFRDFALVEEQPRKNKYIRSFAFTHMNECGISGLENFMTFQEFDAGAGIYFSDGVTAESVRKI